MSCYNPCNPCNPCHAVEVTFPNLAYGTNNMTHLYVGSYGSHTGVTAAVGPISAVYAASQTGTLSGGGGGVMCCCPNNVVLPSQVTEFGTNAVYFGNITIPLCGNLTTVSGNLQFYTITDTVSGTAQVTCCNGVKSVKITSLTLARS